MSRRTKGHRNTQAALGRFMKPNMVNIVRAVLIKAGVTNDAIKAALKSLFANKSKLLGGAEVDEIMAALGESELAKDSTIDELFSEIKKARLSSKQEPRFSD